MYLVTNRRHVADILYMSRERRISTLPLTEDLIGTDCKDEHRKHKTNKLATHYLWPV